MIQLEVGKVYETRACGTAGLPINDWTTKITSKEGEDDDYPFVADNGCTYMESGKFVKYRDSVYDLVKEVTP